MSKEIKISANLREFGKILEEAILYRQKSDWGVQNSIGTELNAMNLYCLRSVMERYLNFEDRLRRFGEDEKYQPLLALIKDEFEANINPVHVEVAA